MGTIIISLKHPFANWPKAISFAVGLMLGLLTITRTASANDTAAAALPVPPQGTTLSSSATADLFRTSGGFLRREQKANGQIVFTRPSHLNPEVGGALSFRPNKADITTFMREFDLEKPITLWLLETPTEAASQADAKTPIKLTIKPTTNGFAIEAPWDLTKSEDSTRKIVAKRMAEIAEMQLTPARAVEKMLELLGQEKQPVALYSVTGTPRANKDLAGTVASLAGRARAEAELGLRNSPRWLIGGATVAAAVGLAQIAFEQLNGQPEDTVVAQPLRPEPGQPDASVR